MYKQDNRKPEEARDLSTDPFYLQMMARPYRRLGGYQGVDMTSPVAGAPPTHLMLTDSDVSKKADQPTTSPRRS